MILYCKMILLHNFTANLLYLMNSKKGIKRSLTTTEEVYDNKRDSIVFFNQKPVLVILPGWQTTLFYASLTDDRCIWLSIKKCRHHSDSYVKANIWNSFTSWKVEELESMFTRKFTKCEKYMPNWWWKPMVYSREQLWK